MQTDLGGSSGDKGSDHDLVAAYCYAARYVYSQAVEQNDNLLRLTAGADACQTPLFTRVSTRPPGRQAIFLDSHGNVTHRARVIPPHQELTILSIGVVRFASPGEYPAEVSLAGSSGEGAPDGYLAPTQLVRPEKLEGRAREIVGPARGLMESVEKITNWVYRNIEYVQASTTVSTTAEEVLRTGVGVCQDMTHLAMGMLKALSIPSRYVCGLLATQVGETHAWLEFWHPHVGWVPSDPSGGQAVAPHGQLIKFAVGQDYREAAPVEGTFRSQGSGGLEAARAQVRLGRGSVTFDDALGLIESLTQ